ncbi:glycosyltransferase family 4 protein [Patescibacteria group bacterium]|nr:glycosyltransferase family 4 protein [Patescibacteria group bacterium]
MEAVKRIGWVETHTKKVGGIVYNDMAREALRAFFDLEVIIPQTRLFSGARLLKLGELLFRLVFLGGTKDLWIRGLYAALTLRLDHTKGKNLVMIHHEDFAGYPWHARLLFSLFWRPAFHWNLKRADGIVVVSAFWNNYYRKKGYKNVFTIYNAFDLGRVTVSEKEVEAFKKKHGLEGKPIIYLGNCQKGKGVVESYKALAHVDAYLVTSGPKHVDIPARNLELEYQEYLALLKASSVVLAMSKFKEGWGRTPHEAMLLKTPVIGSGAGGMKELLEGGGQILCEDLSCLKGRVERLLGNPAMCAELGEKGYNYARRFSLERFEQAWADVLGRFV